MRDSTQIYPLSSERAELSLINQCGCLPLPRPWPLCPFAHLTVAYCSDKKTRLSTRLLLIKTERGFGCSLYLKLTIETIFEHMHCTRDELPTIEQRLLLACQFREEVGLNLSKQLAS